MDNYNVLVSKILANKSLNDAINELVDENCINLVSSNWKEILENNIIYQDYSSAKNLWKSSFSTENYVYEESKYSKFEVLIVSYCKFLKPWKDSKRVYKPNLIVIDSEPLAKIARAMTSDLGSQININGDFKFNFIDCGIMNCSECGFYASEFLKSGIQITRNCQPCIQDTRVYNGKNVVNRFHSQIEAEFPSMFLAILKLKINTRYIIWDSNKQKSYRITGNVLDFVGFTERKLEMPKRINVGLLMQMTEEPKECLKTPMKLNQNEKDPFEEYDEETTEDALEDSSENKKRKFEDEETCCESTYEYLDLNKQ